MFVFIIYNEKARIHHHYIYNIYILLREEEGSEVVKQRDGPLIVLGKWGELLNQSQAAQFSGPRGRVPAHKRSTFEFDHSIRWMNKILYPAPLESSGVVVRKYYVRRQGRCASTWKFHDDRQAGRRNKEAGERGGAAADTRQASIIDNGFPSSSGLMLPFQSRMHPSIDETEGLADHVCLNLETKAGRQ